MTRNDSQIAIIHIQRICQADFCGGLLWNVTLDVLDVAQLTAGQSPMFVKAESLRYYVPMVGDEDKDLIVDLALTPSGNPTTAASPAIRYPQRLSVGVM